MIGPVGTKNAFLWQIDSSANERCSHFAQAGFENLSIASSRDGGAACGRTKPEFVTPEIFC